jgi:TRAP-type C4-dicarboxylate transport system substrate-binding protein
MKLRISHGALALTLLFALFGCERHDDGVETWRFAIEETAGSVQDTYARRFAEEVSERTHGRVRVIVYPYGALGTSDHITEQLHDGTLELAMSSPGHLGKLIPEVQVFSLHFVLSEDESVNARALADPELRRFLDRLYAEKGLAFLTAFGEGTMAWTTRVPIHAPSDFEGVRMRVMTSPLLLASYEAYGASPTPLPYAEVYSALQLRMIDGQVNPVSAIEEMSFDEVTDYLIFPHHAEFVTTLAAHPAWIAGLSGERRELVDSIVSDLALEIDEVQRTANDTRLETIRERRPELVITTLTEDERAAFRERALPVREQYVEMAGPRGRALLRVLERAVARAERESAAASEPR